ncbi:hypothetical protein [Curtobacterium sp. MCBD17_030]|uniref:hypothetical protein n=1 Tax=Curtobacterium sp. MCBD17_030 TaxID=2175649 RepID=UPI000D94E315|nr:hypothetical protein [Curtobacterium sp. MCBD17_030]PYY32271.1 hypothetical protein DEI89_13675 [Curtobacterium sp. MCBD17_030]
MTNSHVGDDIAAAVAADSLRLHEQLRRFAAAGRSAGTFEPQRVISALESVIDALLEDDADAYIGAADRLDLRVSLHLSTVRYNLPYGYCVNVDVMVVADHDDPKVRVGLTYGEDENMFDDNDMSGHAASKSALTAVRAAAERGGFTDLVVFV